MFEDKVRHNIIQFVWDEAYTHSHTHPALVKGVKVAAIRPFMVNLEICRDTKKEVSCKQSTTCTDMCTDESCDWCM